MNGHATLANERLTTNNGGNNNNRRDRNNNRNNNGGFNNRNRDNRDNRNNRNDSHSYGALNYSYSASSYLRDGMDAVESDGNDEFQDTRKDNRAEDILKFCQLFEDNIDDYRKLQDIMIDEFPEAVRHIRSYYSQKVTPAYVDAANKLVKIATTNHFAKILKKVLESQIWADDDGTYDKIWRSIGFLLSVALETNYDRMHNDVIRLYATEILPRMWSSEITQIAIATGVTRDLILDLTIAIPMIGSEWNSANIDAFFPRFLDKMLLHAEDNIDVLNWEVQGMLYDEFFGKNNTGVKIIGKYLASEPKKDSELEGDVQRAVYEEFKKMLYMKLDALDIDRIAYVFKFVAGYRKDKGTTNTMFNSEDARKYENVRKGLLAAMDDKEVMSYLA